ncbi:ParA family protein [Klenkia sp. PcliD-1-E]|uniref:ParA family protein n=1 Tax=Klenkia sp. PcliD-1-E TaxID=2954492 RepID=UPI00209758A5|nr:ParA family protein [Klenkia sp. PcliD-1-E]MCO7220830.1 ParA family protein [Klenkia sp. PcliD-1-E]
MEDSDVVKKTSDERLSRVVALINGKGGVGKTSVTANISGQLARAGYSVLAVDLDLSGNLKLDLGYVGDPLDDDGKGVVDAVWQGQALPVITNVRENLDVVPGGRHLEMLAALAQTPMGDELPGGGVPTAFAERLAELAGDYDVVLLDCAPGNPILQDMALHAAHYVLIPTKTDSAGWEGLRMVGPRVKKARKENPDLSYLGVLLFAHQTTATRVRSGTKARLAEVSDTVPLFDSYIRHSETAAHDCRERGQLAHELARDASDSAKARLNVLRARRPGGEVVALPAQLSGTADSLAGDYEKVAAEMLTRIAAAEASTPISSASGR